MAKVVLNRMRLSMDERLRQEQAGFRPERSCCEQIFTLRQIIEKTVKNETPMLINFVDFKKAFDSLHRESPWKIMKSYGIPQRIIDIIQNFYNGSRCAVRHGEEMGERFQIITGNVPSKLCTYARAHKKTRSAQKIIFQKCFAHTRQCAKTLMEK